MQVHDLARQRCGIVTFTKDDVAAGDAQAALVAQGMNVSVSYPSSRLLDAERRALPRVVRASSHYYNDHSERDRFCVAVERLGT